MLRLSAAAFALLALAITACGTPEPIDEPIHEDPPPGPVEPVEPDPVPRLSVAQVDLAALVPDVWSVDGVAVDALGQVRVLLQGKGIATLDADGGLASMLAFYEHGFDDFGYSDFDVLVDGKLVLAAPNEVVIYDPEEELVSSYFCLEPGFGEIVMVNQSVAVDHEHDRVFAAPAFYDTGMGWTTPFDARHSRYGFDGELDAEVDVLGTGVIAEGLAFDPGRDRLLAVDGDTLSVFKGDGSVEKAVRLEGIEDASGLALDVARDALFVTDRADLELRRFALSALD